MVYPSLKEQYMSKCLCIVNLITTRQSKRSLNPSFNCVSFDSCTQPGSSGPADCFAQIRNQYPDSSDALSDKNNSMQPSSPLEINLNIYSDHTQ